MKPGIWTVAELEKQHPRAYLDERGSYVLAPDGVTRLPTDVRAVLTAEEWRDADSVVERAAKHRLRLVRWLAERGLLLDISAMPDDNTDGFDPRWRGVPPVGERPFTHCPAVVDRKRLERWRSRREPGQVIDAGIIEAAARRVAEAVEKAAVDAVWHALAAADCDLSDPTEGEWRPVGLVRDVLKILDGLRRSRKFGPWLVVHGVEWDIPLDCDYHRGILPTSCKEPITLRERLRQIDGVVDVARVDWLDKLDFAAVQLDEEVVRIICGLRPKLYQWTDGDRPEFRVVAQMFPQVRDGAGIAVARVKPEAPAAVDPDGPRTCEAHP